MSTTDLRSTGQLCQDLQRPHGAIVKAIEEAGIEAAFALNGVRYYGTEAVERIMQQLDIATAQRGGSDGRRAQG